MYETDLLNNYYRDYLQMDMYNNPLHYFKSFQFLQLNLNVLLFLPL